MESTIDPQTEERVTPFWYTKLPLILIPLVLLVFNYFLYARLQAEAVISAETVSAEATNSVEAGVAASAQETGIVGDRVPAEGLSLNPLPGDLIGSGWRVIRGVWVAEEAGLRQMATDEFDQAIVYEPRRFDTYAVDVDIRHLQNVGGGLYINMQDAGSTARSHMIRFETDGAAMFWGHFNDVGEFSGQGFANIDIDPSQAQRLRVAVHNDSYDVILNDRVLAESLPLFHRGGHVGLMATEADVRFERIMVVPIDGLGNAPVVVEDLMPDAEIVETVGQFDTLLEQVETVNGEWVYESGTIRQLQNEATDYLTMLNTLGRSYTLRATVQLADAAVAPDSGAGFIFHMPNRDNTTFGHMVRLLDGGEQVMWGEFNDTGVFNGQGNIALNLDSTRPIDIAVRVRSVNFDILINGEEIVRELPLRAEEGWIGLVAYRGDVLFSNVNLELGGE